MGAAFFYHLTQNPLEDTLPLLLEKATGAGWKIAVRGVEAARMDWLDQRLWQGAEDSFLPHGQAGGEHDALQPILLTIDASLANGASCIMSVDGAQISAEEVQAADRVCILFDGHDPEALSHARAQWKALTDAGCAAQYWSEESGRWEKKAEKAAA
ncbi:DNA polymerase III subunit chi [Cognatishimia sp. 1_MG-2023]|uniref:DNA polymerase III subunit chi n=1 Tax=Cognatishimia sp. 1_MG-2023 TaxID=3062642 RepID=UPI0026E1FB1C|nr:DNA polymerase III subunit chi [Cognatishimia sp. 1_MG-2023]MDO6727450.1 DNA polymerase III subunit chi [Cognatishimia sp. 1_MG-2023]